MTKCYPKRCPEKYLPKYWLLALGGLLLLVVLIMVPEAKAWDLSVSGHLGYAEAKWNGSPDGNHSDHDYPWGIEGRLKFKERWGLKPTLSLSYQRFHFDFSSFQAPIQKATPEFYTAAAGVTKETKWANGFFFIGFTRAYFNPKLFENANGKPFPHKGKPADTYFMFRIGVNKLFKVFKSKDSNLKVGPELFCDIYPVEPHFNRCRWLGMGQIFGWLGLRIQF